MDITFDSEVDGPCGERLSAKLAPAGLEHHADGSVSVDGKLVDNPEDYKDTPMPNPLRFAYGAR